MKNKHFYLITLLLMSLSINSLYGQDIIDPPKLQNSLLNLNSNFIKRDFNKFMISWNLTSPNRTMDSLLHINYALTVASSMPDWQILPSTNPDSNWYYFGRPVSQNGPDYLPKQYRLVCTEDYYAPNLLFGYAMRYNPAINVDSTDSFIPNANNADGTVFGWKIKNGVSSNPSKPGTVKLRTTLVNEQVVLESIWKNDALFYRSNTDDYNGNTWVMDIHIKADTNLIPVNLTDSTVLKIEMPYHFDPVNYIASDGNKLIRTTDGGSTWEIDSSIKPFNCKSIYFYTHNLGWVCGNNGRMYNTIDAGITWKRIIDTSITTNLFCIKFFNYGNGFICGENGLLKYTNDTSKHWQNVTITPQVTSNINSISLIKNSNNVYAVGDAGHFLKSTNGGANWKDTTITAINLNSVFFVDANNGWVVGNSGHILKTINAGTTWTRQLVTSYRLNSVFFVNNTIGFAAGENGLIFRTNDAGINWYSMPIATTGTINSIFFSDTNRGWVVGNNNLVFKTTDCGSNWSQVNLGLAGSVNLNDISFKYSDNFGKIKFTKFYGASNYGIPIYAKRGAGINDYRGLLKQIRIDDSNILEIKGENLITNDDYGSNDYITLSVMIKCDDMDNGNPYFKTTSGPNYSRIKDFDIKVTYKPLLNLILGNISVSTPHARQLFFGQLDSAIAYREKRLLSRYEGPLNYDSAYIHRFYGDNEIGPDLWACNRYYNMLVDTLAALETFSPYNPQFMHATGFKEFWNGSNLEYQLQTFAPYIKQGTNENCGSRSFCRSFGTAKGYGGIESIYTPLYNNGEIKKSKYEIDQDGLPNFNNNSDSILTHKWLTCLQSNLEGNLFSNYVNHKSMLFSGKPWSEWLFPLSLSWLYDSSGTKTISTSKARPCTGEEFNLMSRYSVFLGSRGVFYWLKTRIYDILHMDEYGGGSGMGLQASDSMAYIDSLKKDITQFDNPVMNNDFIDFTRDDPQYLWNRYFHSYAYAWNVMNIDSSRVYIGLQTLRYEIKKFNEWIDHNNDLLMKLKLIAWFGKGHAIINIANNKLSYPYTIDDFIVSDSIFTRPLGRMQGGYPLYEQGHGNDSGFVDVMVEQIDTTHLDKMYLLNVINRRSDPLVYVSETYDLYNGSDPVEPNHLFEGFRFYSTHEIETNCENDGKAIDPTSLPEWGNPDLRVAQADLIKHTDYWRNLYWQRQGIREIKILMKTIDPAKKFYYKVEEVTDGVEFSPSLSWCKKEEIKNRVNTTLKQGEYLTLKMLPGSGKMMKVTIIEDNTTPIIGELAFSNQTKLIGYAKNQNSDSSFYMIGPDMHFYQDDSLYYHITYHRESPSFSKVYYRRSLSPYKKNVDPRIIQWGPEFTVSNTISVKSFHDCRIGNDSIVYKVAGRDISCKYPAMVIRYNDSLNCQCAYIVYTCSYGDRPDSVRCLITETVFPSNFFDTPNIPQTVVPIAIAYIYNPNPNGIDDFGHVSINASKSGNYYAFSDSLYGICTAWKTARNRGYLTNRTYLRYNPGVSNKCGHPCLNTYSRLSSLEDDCALVWQENTYGLQNIIYTRLFHTGNTVTCSIPNFDPSSTPLYTNAVPNGANNMAKINDVAGIMPELPIVYRPVEFAARPGNESIDRSRYNSSIWDRVYWQAIDYTGYKSLYLKNVDIDEYTNYWYMLPQKRIFANNSNLAQPNVSQGCVSPNIYANYWDLVGNDSTLILSFIKYINSPPTSANSTVFQIDHKLWFNQEYPVGVQYEPNKEYTTIDNYIEPLGTGLYPHLARIPAVVKNDDWFLNRRVFQGINNQIQTTSQLFLKEGVETQKTSYPLISISNMKSGKTTTISDFYLDDVSSPMIVRKTKSQFADVKDGRIIYKDKIFTNWFKISEINNMNFFTTKNDSNIIKFEIERKSDGKKFNMSIKSNISEQPSFNKLVLINGKNDLYRIVMNYDKKTCLITEELMISEPIDFMRTDTLSDKHLSKSDIEKGNEQYIDLGGSEINTSNDISINAYPNPSDNAIYVSYNLPLYLYTNRFNEAYKTAIILYSMNGQIITKKEAAPGEVISFQTSDLPTGAYFLKAVFNNLNSSDYNNLQGFKTVIIQH